MCIEGKVIVLHLKVAGMKAIRISHGCLFRAGLWSSGVWPGMGLRYSRESTNDLCSKSMASCLLCPLLQPANSTSPGSLAQCANGLCEIGHTLCQVLG